MKRWLWSLLVGLGLTASAALTVWLARPWLERELAGRLEVELGAATGMPAAVSALHLDLFPPRLTLDLLALGPQDSTALEIAGVVADLDPFAWAAVVHVDEITADFAKWPLPPSQAGTPGGSSALPSWLPSVTLTVDEVEAQGDAAASPCRLQAAPLKLHLTRHRERVSAGVDVGDLRLQRAEETTHVEHLSAAAELRGGMLLLRSARIVGDLGSVVAGAEGDRPATEATPLEAHLALDLLARFLGIPERIGGSLEWIGEIRLPATGVSSVEDLHLDGKLEVSNPVYEDFTARGLKAEVALEDARLRIRSLQVDLDQGRVSGAAEVGLHSPHQLRVDVAAEVQDPAALASWSEKGLASGPVAVHLVGAGELSPLSVAGSLTAKLSALRRLSPDPPTRRSAAVPPALDANLAVDFHQLERGTEAKGNLHLVASDRPSSADAATIDLLVRLAGDGALSGSVGVLVPDARQLQPLAPAATAGRMEGQVELAGSLEAPLFDGSLRAENLVLAGVRFERIGGAFAAGSDFFLAKPLELRALGGLARLEGNVGLAPQTRNDWRASLERVDLAAVWIVLDSLGVSLPYLTGVVQGEASARGAWKEVDLSARLASGALTVGTERFTSLALRAQAKAQQWSLDGELSRGGDESLRLAGGGTGTSRLWLSSWSTPWRVDGFRFIQDHPARRGSAVFSADFYGPLDALQGKAQLTVADLGFGARTLGTFTGEVDLLPNGEYRLFVGDSAERLLVRGSMRGEPGRPFSLGAELRHFDLADVLAPEQAATVAAEGSLHLEGRGAQVMPSLSGELRLTQFEIGREALSMKAVAPIVARVRNGRVEISSFDLRGDFGSVDVRGGIGFDGGIALDVRADADARLAEAIPKSPVKWATGSVSLDAQIRRPAGGATELAGHGSVQQLSIDLGLPFLMTDANGAFALEGSRITLEQVRGGAGGGTFVLSGFVDIAEGPSLRWEVEDVNSGFLDWLQDEVSGKGEIRGTWDATEIAGEIRVGSALYDRNLELTDLLPTFRRNLGPTPPKPGEKAIRLDLRILAPDSIFIDNNIARAELRADLHIGGSDLDPRLRGEVELLDGQATLFDRRFEITLGRVIFDGGPKINPQLEFSATTDISTAESDYSIVASVSGTLDNPRIALTADDGSLSTTDVAALLTMGRTVSQLQSEGSGVSVNDLAALAPFLYGASLEKSVKRFLPIDRFTLEPGFSRTTGDFEPKITVGAELARNLRGTLSTTIGVQTQNAVQLEYQLTPRMFVVASWVSRTETAAGGFGGAFKMRYRFRYLPRYTLLPADWWPEN